jgi:Ca2+-binding EF-hand superfamily protein
MMAGKAGETAKDVAFGLLDTDDHSGKIDINQLAAIMPIINRNWTPSMLLDYIKKLGYKGNGKLDITEFGELFRTKGAGRHTVLQCLKK